MTAQKKGISGVKKIVIALVLLFLYLLSNALRMNLFGLTTATIVGASVNFIVVICVSLASLYFMKTTKVFEEKLHLRKKTNVWLFILGLIMIAFLLMANVIGHITAIFSGGVVLIVISLLTALSAGFLEEFLIRGLAFQGIMDINAGKKNQLILSAALSSVLFGVVHFPNLLQGAPMIAVLQQVFYATVLGLVFAVLRIATNGLAFPVLLHALIDFKPTIATAPAPSQNSLIDLLIVLSPIAIIALICLVCLNTDRVKSQSIT